MERNPILFVQYPPTYNPPSSNINVSPHVYELTPTGALVKVAKGRGFVKIVYN
jgi:hypothetical protein